jgi:hypothetical protein
VAAAHREKCEKSGESEQDGGGSEDGGNTEKQPSLFLSHWDRFQPGRSEFRLDPEVLARPDAAPVRVGQVRAVQERAG